MPADAVPAPKATPDARTRWAGTLILAAAATAAYLPSFSVPFLMDDLPSIVDNPTIRGLGRSWQPPADSGLTVSGRPLLNFTLALNYALSGTDVWSYHLVNLLIHIGAALLLFNVAGRTLRLPSLGGRFGDDTTPLALAIAVLWALHPLQTESVTYVVQRAECLVGLLYLLTFHFFLRAVETPEARRWKTLTVLACIAGMASKEVMATAPPLLALYDRLFTANNWAEVIRKRGWLHLTLAATWLVLGGLILSSGARGGTVDFDGAITPASYALTQTYAIVTYLRLAFWPVGLVFDYGVPQALGWEEIAPEFAGFIFLLGATGMTLWRAPRAGYCLVFFLGILGPTSSVVPVVTQTMTEHRMYLPLAGIVALVVPLAYLFLRRGAFVLLGVVAVALGIGTYHRNLLYQSDLALWEDTARKRPDNLRAHLNIGIIHYRAGRYAEAASAYARALELDPNLIEAANNLGNVLQRLGRMDEAADHFELALRGLAGRDRAITLSNLGSALLEAGRLDAARSHLLEAVALAPDLPIARSNLANALLQAGEAAASLDHYEAALRELPDDHDIRGNYANALLEVARHSEAVQELQLVVRARPESAEAHNNLGVAFALAGRPAEARAHFRRAVELAPDFRQARENLARSERALGTR